MKPDSVYRKKKLIAGIFLFAFVSLFAQEKTEHKVLEFGILDYSGGGGDGFYRVAGDLFFHAKMYSSSRARNELLYNVKPGYNNTVWFLVANRGGAAAKFTVEFKTNEAIMMGRNNEGGDTPFELPANSTVDLPVTIFSHDATEGFYEFEATLKREDGSTADQIRGQIFVEPVTPEIEVKLVKKEGLIHIYEFTNKGEPLPNFSIELQGAQAYTMTPRVDHYLFPAKETFQVSVHPVLPVDEDLDANFLIDSSGVKLSHPVELKIPEGMSVEVVSIDPIARLRKKSYYCTNRPIIHLDFDIPYVKLRKLKSKGTPRWLAKKIQEVTKKGKSYDTVHNKQKDHWDLVVDGVVMMSADDYDKDGKVDFFRETDAKDRTLNRAYVKIKGRWHETNIVSAYMVSTFLPMHGGAHVKPHQVDILMNKKLIRRQKNVIPRGSSVFRLNLGLLNQPKHYISKNRVTVSTKHMPRHSYQVSAENTLVVHYSSIDVPLGVKKPVKLNTSKIDKLISQREEELHEVENEAEKELYKAQLEELKKDRDRILKLAADMSEYEVQGIQHKGPDLALFSNETGHYKNKIYGHVRNMGYETNAYRLKLEVAKPGEPFKTLESRELPLLPPFSRRRYEFIFDGYDPRKRRIYRVSVEMTNSRVRGELALSNNQVHIISGPPGDEDQRRKEMRVLASEMGVYQDQVTLTRKTSPQARINRLTNYVEQANRDRMTTQQVHFSTPMTNIDKNQRVFILED